MINPRKIPVPESVIEQAANKCTGDKFNNHTMMKGGSGQEVGHTGELMFAYILDLAGFDFDHVGDSVYDHDFVCDGLKIDIKTKKRGVDLNGEYNLNVCSNQDSFNCDMYVFASYNWKSKTIQFAGHMWKSEFWSKCERYKAGQVDDENFTHRADAGVIKYKDLPSMVSFYELIKWNRGQRRAA